MLKKMFWLLLFSALPAWGQISQPVVVPIATTPSTCSNFFYALTTASPWTIYAPTAAGACQALSAAGSGVTSFNGRTGAVVPAANDYSFSQISGNPSAAQVDGAGLLSNSTTGNAGTATAAQTVPSGCLSGAWQYPCITAVADQTGASANISSTVLYAVPSNGAGTYIVGCYLVLTQAATSSSTLPYAAINFVDEDTGVTLNNNLACTTGGSTGNTVGTTNGFPIASPVIHAKVSSNINWFTAGYASSGVTSMQYAVHIKLTYVGP